MEYQNFSQLQVRVQQAAERKKVAVVAAEEEHALQAAINAWQENIVQPLLLGDAARISRSLADWGVSLPEEAIIPTEDSQEAVRIAVEMIHRKEADFLMKGGLQTADLMRVVVDSEEGLRSGRLMSHVAFLEIPNYHKLLIVTDGGMVLHPGLAEKKFIIENAVSFMRKMGYTQPKVAIMAAVEHVSPKMQETVDAVRLKHMNEDGQIQNCLIEGPISYDLAVSKESAEIKDYESPVTGDVDVMLVPTIAAGNLLAKGLIYSGGAKMAGVIVGAKVPIVLTSRGASAAEKFFSLVLAASAV